MTVPDAILATLAALSAALISFSLCPAMGRWAERIGVVSIPSKDRWRRNPTPLLGGVAIGERVEPNAKPIWWHAMCQPKVIPRSSTNNIELYKCFYEKIDIVQPKLSSYLDALGAIGIDGHGRNWRVWGWL